MLCCSRARHQGAQPASGGAAGHRRAARVPRGGVPQHHQLLDQEPWRDAAGRVSRNCSLVGHASKSSVVCSNLI